jgi:hypothetical protein
MKILLSAFLSLGVVAIFYTSQTSKAAPTPEDYPLVCRGGGGLVVGIAPGERNIGFIFVHGTKPAGEGLAPGECSWVDRGMYPNEPDSVSQHVEEGSDSLKVGGTLAPENRWYEELHSADSYWTFMVSNNGRGQLIATSARPNNKKVVSPTARMPSAIGQITRPDLPAASATNSEVPKVIVLNRPTGPSSGMEVMKGLPGGRSIDIPPAPRALSMEEKVEILKSAGITFELTAELPYVTLTPRHPYVDGRGGLGFHGSTAVSTHYDNAMFILPSKSWLSTVLNFKTAGIYLMTFTVSQTEYPGSAGEFVFTTGNYYLPGTKQTFTGTEGTQRLNVVVDVAEPGEYEFTLIDQGSNFWFFYSCEVTKVKK